MGLFSSLEDKLEKYVEILFDHYKGCIRPLEVAAKLNRVMRDLKQVSINHIFVPNHYTIILNPEDYQGMSSLFTRLINELEHYLQEKAKEKNYTLLAPVRITFKQDENLKAGHMNVEGVFSEEKYIAEKGVLDSHEDTLFFLQYGKIAPESKNRTKKASLKVTLKVTDGTCQEQEISLDSFPAIIGRQVDCDIIIRDSSVSRRHARLESKKTFPAYRLKEYEWYLCLTGSALAL